MSQTEECGAVVWATVEARESSLVAVGLAAWHSSMCQSCTLREGEGRLGQRLEPSSNSLCDRPR